MCSETFGRPLPLLLPFKLSPPLLCTLLPRYATFGSCSVFFRSLATSATLMTDKLSIPPFPPFFVCSEIRWRRSRESVAFPLFSLRPPPLVRNFPFT